MTTSLSADLDAAIHGQRLLDHPFYRRWTAGTLGVDELGAYAAQYRHIERSQPRWLTGVAAGLTDQAALAVGRVLADEIDPDATHADLFDRFAAAVGAPDAAEPGPAARALIATIDGFVADGPASGLGALLAYELQSAAVSREKADGLRCHFGIDGDGAAFWDLHSELDARHSGWLVDALEDCAGAMAAAAAATRTTASAWWAFLDEREAAAAIG